MKASTWTALGGSGLPTTKQQYHVRCGKASSCLLDLRALVLLEGVPGLVLSLVVRDKGCHCQPECCFCCLFSTPCKRTTSMSELHTPHVLSCICIWWWGRCNTTPAVLLQNTSMQVVRFLLLCYSCCRLAHHPCCVSRPQVLVQVLLLLC